MFRHLIGKDITNKLYSLNDPTLSDKVRLLWILYDTTYVHGTDAHSDSGYYLDVNAFSGSEEDGEAAEFVLPALHDADEKQHGQHQWYRWHA